MKVEYDYSSLHWRNMEKELQEELDARSDEEKERDRIAAERELEELYRIMDEVNEREQKTVRIVDVEKAVNFQRVVETLKRSAEFNCDRMVWEVKEDQSFGYIKYYTYGIIHIGDDQGDRTRQMWAKIFDTFDDISITAENDLLCVYIPAYFTKPLP